MSLPCPECGAHHQNQCHKCPHHEDVSRGKYANVPWEKTPCSACIAGGNGCGMSHKGRSMQTLLEGQPEVSREREGFSEPSDDNRMLLQDFLSLLIELAELPPRARDVVLLRMINDLGRASWTYKRISQRIRISTQAAEQIHRKAIEQSAVLQRIFALKRLFGTKTP